VKNVLQINYWTIGGFDGGKPVAQALEEAKKMGFEGVELTFDGTAFGPGVTRAECLAIRRKADDLGMSIATLASGKYWGLSLSDPKAAVRKKAIAYTEEYLQAAAWVGAKVCLVVPGAVTVPWEPGAKVVPYAEVWENATASIKALLPTAAKLKVKIGVENVWNWFLADPVAMGAFVDQFKSAWVGVYFDIANGLINSFPEHWIEILGKRIAAVHVKNFTRSDCGGGLHGFGDDLLKGDVNFPAVIKALKKAGYAGPLTAEMIPFSRLPNLVLPDMALARDTAVKMRKIFR